MYELNNRIRLIDVTAYPITNSDAFIGYLCGLISRDNDLEQIFLDSFLKIAKQDGADISPVLDQIRNLSDTYHVDFTISISVKEQDLPEQFKEFVISD